jgi:hypothetical protein
VFLDIEKRWIKNLSFVMQTNITACYSSHKSQINIILFSGIKLNITLTRENCITVQLYYARQLIIYIYMNNGILCVCT